MKIKATQLDKETRNAIVKAVDYYACHLRQIQRDGIVNYSQLATSIIHGELILCEYQYNEQEKGGEYETGH